MDKFFRTIAAGTTFSLLFYCLGCGVGNVQDLALATPAISQVSPQTIPAGSQTTTLKVSGTNFPAKAAILWNGAPLTTTVVDANTLSGTIGSGSLTTPATVQLKVQNTQTMQESQPVPVVIAADSNPTPNLSSVTISTTSLPQGSVSAAYTTTLSAAGGTSPYTWSISSGQLPAGLILAANTGVISGTPTASGAYPIGVTATDSSSPAQTATANLTLSVTAAPATPSPLVINTTSLPSGTIGSGYLTLLQASGGSVPYTWSIASGNLPAGLSLTANTGVISGVPTTAGTSTFTATAADAANPSQTKSVTLSLSVAPVSLVITTSSLPAGTIGAGYGALLQAGGGTAPYTWSITAGSLPVGLTLSKANGIVSGTPTTAGTSTFTATATDSGNPALTKSANLSIVIASTTLSINTSALPSGTQNAGYSALLQAGGGTAPYTWSVTTGSLPAGLTLNNANGIIFGTPTTAGTSSFTVTAADSGNPAQTKSANFSIVIAPTTLSITSAALPSGTQGAAYSRAFQASGGTTPYTWTLTSGALPAGLTLAANGVVSGTPTASGNFSVGVTVKDAGNQTATANGITLSIVASGTPLSISSTSVPGATTNQSYVATLNATGGTGPYSWSITTGSLPAGLTLVPATGIIAGTPTTSGTASFTATVTDAENPAQTKSVNLSIAVTTTSLVLGTSSVPSATKGTAYSALLNANGGTTPYTWSVTTGSLPAGLTLSANNGLISGTPTATGTSAFTATVTDAGNPTQTKSVALSIVVAAPTAQPLTVSTSSVPSATKGTSYSALLNANGGTTPYTWSVTTGSLPAGLTLSANNGLISGTPTATGTSAFTATVTDAGNPAQTKSVALSIVVAAAAAQPLTISTSSLPAGTKSTAYTSLLQAGGGTTPYTWAVTTGSLPAGITLAPTTGAISGTPTATGTSAFTVTVTDAGNPVQTKSVALSIVVGTGSSSALTITAALPSGIVGTSYSSSMSATGGTPAYTYSISGALPGGLTLAATTGVISGTPTATGTFNFTATVTDNSNPVQTKSVATSIVVATASEPTGPGTTWYVRADGGTRYSTSQTQGQCDGKTDAAYPGSGTNQHCAFNDVRYLWTDGTNTFNPKTNFPAWGWIGTGGDTYIVRGGPWRIGQNGPNNNQGLGLQGDPYDAGIPPPFNGTSGQHTRILGENFGSCTTSNETQLYGGYGVGVVLDLRGSQFVDVECVELTRHSQCIKYGSSPAPCNNQYPLDDYAVIGILTNTSTHDILLQDMYIHGFTSRGINGPIGGTVSATRVDIAYNGASGWDFDDGNATPSINAVLNLSYVTIEWNGCNQAYPGTGAVACYDDNSGGYGDGIGTPAGTCLASHVDHSIFRYNTQDGFDMLHNDTGSCSLNITDSMSYGNMGQQFKWGPADSPGVFTNNLAIGNCNRMSQPMPGQPSTFNAHLTDFCRAQDTIVPGLPPGGSLIMENNTIVSYAPTIVDFECSTSNCSTTTFTFENNIMLGYDNPATYKAGSQVGGPGAFFFSAPVNAIRSNNIYYGMGHGFTCPSNYTSAGAGTGTSEKCTSPLLINQPTGTAGNFVETELDNFNFDITPGSPAVGAGLFLPGLTVDYTGAARGNPPSIGAYEK